MSEQNEKLRCIFCGEFTGDWWFADFHTGECRCHECMKKGITETEQEKSRFASGNFTPVRNRDLFQSNFLNDQKKSQRKSADFHLLRFAPQASLIEYSPCLNTSVSFPRDYKRGDILGFSRRSRSRLNKKIALVSRGALPLFVTLTYHEDIPQNFEGYKYHLHHFFISLFRKFPHAGAIWKLEYQFRGYAHYHLFLWGVPLEQRDFISNLWHEIAGYGSEDHLKWHLGLLGNGNEHCVQPIRSWNGVRSYASKYFSKCEDGKNIVGTPGRIWGIRGKVPFSKILEFRVSLDVALQFRAVLARELNFDFQRLGFWCSNFSPDWLLFFYDLCESEWVENHPPEDPPDWEDFIEVFQEGFEYV